MTEDYADVEPTRAEVEALTGTTVLEFGSPFCGHCLRAQRHKARDTFEWRDHFAHDCINGHQRVFGHALQRLQHLVAHRLRTPTQDDSEQARSATTPSAPSALQVAGDIGLALGELIGFFQALPLVLDGRTLALLAALIAAAGSLIARRRARR